LTIDKGITVGDPKHFDNLTVFPVYAAVPAHLGSFVTLDTALEAKMAVVREAGSGDDATANDEGSSARVDTLVIENKGDKPIIVLAGTVVTGGKQDRTIAQDFVIPPGKTTSVAAFCVEQSRWDANRQGVATGGRFTTLPALANAEVRNAGQFDKDQTKVWREVARMNEKNGKKTDTGTLAATLDDVEISKRRDALAAKAIVHMAQQQPTGKVVGLAYGVGGRIHAVRWFMNNELFMLHRDKLLKTAALEAISAQPADERQASSDDKRFDKRLSAKDIAEFVASVQTARAETATERKDDNVRRSYGNKKGYGWSLDVAASASPKAAEENAPAAPVTKGFRSLL